VHPERGKEDPGYDPGRGWPWNVRLGPPSGGRSPGGTGIVSIVTPSFNQARYLEETIRSVLAQDYHSLEYQVVDGGSTDGSQEIIRKYEPWISWWVSEKDRGQSHAINKGWERSHGRFVGWLNSDDVLLQGAIREAVEVFEAHAEAAVVHGVELFVDPEGEEIERFGFGFDLASSLDGCNCTIAQQSAFIRRTNLEKAGLLDEDLHRAMDYDLWLRLAMTGPLVHVPRVWSKFRQHPEAKTSTMTLRGDMLRIMEKFYARADLPPELRRLRGRSMAWGHLFKGLADRREGARIAPLGHALRALMSAPKVCLRSGFFLFAQVVGGEGLRRRLSRARARGRWAAQGTETAPRAGERGGQPWD
jgi:hypothetical protein